MDVQPVLRLEEVQDVRTQAALFPEADLGGTVQSIIPVAGSGAPGGRDWKQRETEHTAKNVEALLQLAAAEFKLGRPGKGKAKAKAAGR